MQPLTVPVPELAPGAAPEIEQPLEIALGAPSYPDARPVARDEVRVLGAFVYRSAGAGEELWDEARSAWVAATSDAEALARLEPIPLVPADDDAARWRGTLVAAGSKDGAGRARFVVASGGAPAYRLRAFARVLRAGVEHRGVSAPTPDLSFASGASKRRFAIELDPDEPREARRARVLLKNAALAPAGYLEVRALGGQEVELANCDEAGAVLARVTLTPQGDVRLEPAPGRAVVLAGPLEAQQVSYVPQGGGARLTL